MKFRQYCEYLSQLEATSSRNEMVLTLARMLAKLNAEEVREAMYMLQGRVAPLFVPIEFNFSNKLLLRALKALNPNMDPERIYKDKGDIGLTAEMVSKERSNGLSIIEVFKQLKKITTTKGKNSQSGKANTFLELARQTDGLELKYIGRIVVGNLRIGLSDKTILDSLSWMLAGDKSLRPEIEYAFGVSADLGLIAEILKEKGIGGLKKLDVTVGVPLAAKLVEREKTLEAVMERFGECFIQPKYDGLRAQIHYSRKGFAEGDTKEQVRIFSRSMESLTHMLPDIVKAISEFDVDSIIIDSEAIGYNAQTGEMAAFQETIKRRRKIGVDTAAQTTPLKAFCFDIMELNGKGLLKTPLQERLRLLEKTIKQNKSETIVLSETPFVKNIDELQLKFDEYVELGLEGLIAKGKDTLYDPGTRNYDWIKLKAASQSHLADTVDAVVLGYYRGTGIRAKFGIGALLIGYYDESREKFFTLAKLGTGFKDTDWIRIKKRLDEIRVEALPKNVEINKQLLPDVIVKPEVVVVVEADSISKSTLHGPPGEEGFSLRFPRLKEFDRIDKNPQHTTDSGELEKLFNLQK